MSDAQEIQAIVSLLADVDAVTDLQSARRIAKACRERLTDLIDKNCYDPTPSPKPC